MTGAEAILVIVDDILLINKTYTSIKYQSFKNPREAG